MRIDDLRFLVGAWRGEGSVRGRPAESRAECAPFAGDLLRMDVETRSGGAVVHRERIVFRGDDAAGGAVTASTSPWRGAAQVWRVTRRADGVFRLEHPGFSWEIAPDGPDAYEERFDAVGASGREPVVALRHRREGAPS